MAGAPAIVLDRVTKRYRTGGGIGDVSLQVERGEVFGFLGPNGSGKSTTIRLILDLLRPDAGSIEILGLDARTDGVEARRRIGYLPGELNLYERLTGRDLLDHLASLRAPAAAQLADADIEPLAERLSLDLDRRIKELSRGNKQKVGLVQALMGQPELVILDEPTGGLDPLVQREVHVLIDELRIRGATVFLSSHVLSEVSLVADRVGILRDGELVATEAVADLHARSVHRVEVRTAQPLPPDSFSAVPGVRVHDIDGTRCELHLTGPVDPLIKALATVEVVDLVIGEPDLEETFLAYYETAREGDDA